MQAAQAARVEARLPGPVASTAAPIASRRASTPSQASATPTGSGGTSASRGQRASASPIRIPGWMPKVSAARETSPTNCSRPGSGASAAGSRSSALAPAGGDGELEARKEDADDHRIEHMFASDECGVQVHVRGHGRIGRVDVHAARLRELHRPGEPLVLANAWDAESARRFAALGFSAIATTSGGVARALGYEDGQATPPGEMLAAVARIAAAVEVPVSADMEAGYGLAAGELAERLLETRRGRAQPRGL